jgi:hypothetical protein
MATLYITNSRSMPQLPGGQAQIGPSRHTTQTVSLSGSSHRSRFNAKTRYIMMSSDAIFSYTGVSDAHDATTNHPFRGFDSGRQHQYSLSAWPLGKPRARSRPSRIPKPPFGLRHEIARASDTGSRLLARRQRHAGIRSATKRRSEETWTSKTRNCLTLH